MSLIDMQRRQASGAGTQCAVRKAVYASVIDAVAPRKKERVL
ncbi:MULTISPECIES: hypothetical protein [Paraburkholderia]|nr:MULTISPECIES: hypothetical protein [Paraburkholderia]MCX4160102.1 hypothetical protein [Paraburkholderia megapolitana]